MTLDEARARARELLGSHAIVERSEYYGDFYVAAHSLSLIICRDESPQAVITLLEVELEVEEESKRAR